MKLNTVEQFLLLAKRPVKAGFAISDVHLSYGMVGAILLEMSLLDMIEIKDDRLVLKNSISSGNPTIAEVESVINASTKTRKVKYWVSKLARRSRKSRWAALAELENKNLIRIENKTFLGIIPYSRSYLTNQEARNTLIRELNSSILSGKELSNEAIVVLGLVEACKMHKIIANNRQELKYIRKELKGIIRQSPIANAVDKTIKEVQAAVTGTIIASTVAASSSSH